jgi:hypothetical protein
MASLVVAGDTSGAITIAAPAVAGTNTLTLPASTGTLVVTGGAQTIEFADGSAAAPSITNSGDTNTGMFFPAADTIAFTEGGTEAMRLDSSGNVGINTTSPGVKLGVVDTSAGAATFPAIFGNRGTTVSTQANIGLQTYDAGSAGITNVIGSVTTSATGGAGSADMVFQTTGSGTRAERMRITSGGNVGIATSSPTSGLEVYRVTSTTGSLTDASLMLSTSATTGRKVSIGFGLGGGVANTCAANIGYDVTNGAGAGLGDIYFSTRNTTADSVPSERMRLFSTGNLTIGANSDASYRLYVASSSTAVPALYLRSSASGDAGTAQIRLIKNDSTNTSSQIFIQFVIDGNNTGSGQINANGASQAAFGSFSDVRLKENIENLPSQLSNIMALRPVEFDYKNGSGHQIGFIAQEMQEIYEDAIGFGENDMLTITGWSKTEARLVKAMQEINIKVDAQATTIQEQQQIINDLKARIETLENT